ncbi:MAG: hypothetical protein WCT08_02470 [Patescibacteria group bacterium]
MTELAKGGIDIILPENDELRRALQELLERTKQSLEQKKAEHVYSAPEMFTTHNAIILLLEELLEKNKINTWDFSRLYVRKWGCIVDEQSFAGACEQILLLVDPDYFKNHPVTA